MTGYEFYQRVQQLANLSSAEEARSLTDVTLRSMKSVLRRQALEGLRAQLPNELAMQLEGSSGEGDELIDKEVFIGRLMNNLETEGHWDKSLGGLDLVSVSTGDEAARQTQSVLAAIRESVDERTSAAIEASLPAEISDWYRAPSPTR